MELYKICEFLQIFCAQSMLVMASILHLGKSGLSKKVLYKESNKRVDYATENSRLVCDFCVRNGKRSNVPTISLASPMITQSNNTYTQPFLSNPKTRKLQRNVHDAKLNLGRFNFRIIHIHFNMLEFYEPNIGKYGKLLKNLA
jgi:hypothetical protein